MKANKLFLLVLLSLSLSACSVIPTNTNNGGNNNNNPTPDNGDNNNNNNNNNNNGNQDNPVVTPIDGYDHTESFGGSGSSSTTTKMQDTPILHCWNWSLTNIANNLSNIKEAGFKTIQLSPMQPQKDYYTGQNWSSQWWKLYQPLGFKVAGNNENVLGNKDDLTNLCKKAKNAGVDVIVDVVSNHLAGGSKTSLNQAVRSFEADIYNNNLIHSYGDWAKDTNLQSIVQGNIGDYPDLKTETTTVQNRVLSLLKEYIDCGVNGFRFDAAKHIETPDDGTYASQYWPTILDGVATYADSVGKEKPYCYGEILTTCGNGRSYSSYTKYMSVIDNSQGTKILNAVIDKNLTKVSDETYNSKVNPNKLVLWAESHDTYANDEKETTRVSIENINKTYLIQTSRKDASTLYFARPANAMMGNIGDTSYKNSEIKAINEFHNQFVGHSENISTSDGCFVNERGNDGVFILPISNSSNSATIDVNNLNNGTYVDLITKKEFQVNNKKVSVNFSNNYGVILVNKNGVTPVNQSGNLPKVTISYNDVNNSSSKILVSKQNCDLLTYQINNGNINTLSGNELSLNNEKDGLLKIKFIASNNQGEVNYTINIIKTTSLYNKSLIIYNIDSTQTYLGWLWKDNGEGKWCDFIKEGEIMGLDIGDNNKFIIVTFPSGTTSSNASWDNKISQSNDISYSQRLYDFINL